MVSTRKFSEFTAAGDLELGNIAVGLEAGVNAKFDVPLQFLPTGDTASRPLFPPTPSIRYNTDSSLFEFWNGLAWEDLSVGSDVSNATNIGLGIGIFSSKVGSVLEFKSLTDGPNVVITDNGTEVDISLINVITDTQGIAPPGGFLLYGPLATELAGFKALIAGTGMQLSATDTEITITNIATANGFPFQRTFFVALGGSDTNTGTTINDPFLTIQAAINAAQLFPVANTVRNVINIMDAGTYSEALTISNLTVDIYAPNATFFNGSLTMNAPVVPTSGAASGNRICFKSWIDVTYTDIAGGVPTVNYNNINLLIDYVYNSDITINNRGVEHNFNYWDAATCTITALTNSPSVDIVFAINNTGPTFPSPLTTVVLPTYVNVTGFIGTLNLTPGLSVNVGSTDQNIDIKWADHIVRGTPAGSNVLLKISSGLNSIAPIGWQALFVRDAGNGGNLKITTDAGINLICTAQEPQTEGDGGWFILKKAANNEWFVGGIIQGSQNTTSIYVSKLYGDDSVADGSMNRQFSTIQAAVNFVGAPANRTTIFITDDESYDENVVVSQPNINIQGLQASIDASVGDALTVTTVAGVNVFFLGAISAIGVGNFALRSTGGAASVVVARVVSIPDGDVENASGSILINAQVMLADLINVGTGSIFYNTTLKGGVETPGAGNIDGLSINGTSQSFNIGGTLSVNNAYSFPTVDGASGDVLTTDGFGGVTFQPTGVGYYSLPLNNVVGVAQAAAIDNGYICQNAALTTVTLPAIAPLGSVVKVYGQGAGGWTLAANAGQTIGYGSVNTSVAGSLSSVDSSNLVLVTCLVANTTWRVDYAFSAGLTVV